MQTLDRGGRGFEPSVGRQLKRCDGWTWRTTTKWFKLLDSELRLFYYHVNVIIYRTCICIIYPCYPDTFVFIRIVYLSDASYWSTPSRYNAVKWRIRFDSQVMCHFTTLWYTVVITPQVATVLSIPVASRTNVNNHRVLNGMVVISIVKVVAEYDRIGWTNGYFITIQHNICEQ